MWSRLGSNQRPSRCERDALPLSHGTVSDAVAPCTRQKITRLRADHQIRAVTSGEPAGDTALTGQVAAKMALTSRFGMRAIVD